MPDTTETESRKEVLAEGAGHIKPDDETADIREIDTVEADTAETDAVENRMDDLEQIAAGMPANGKNRRIAAMLGIILLVVLIVLTFVVACLDFEGSGQAFLALLLCDFVVPVLMWFILRFSQFR